MNLLDVIRADWAAEPNKADRIPTTIFRVGQWSHGRKALLLIHLLYKVADAIIVRGLLGAEIPPSIKCGPGFRLRHLGRGVIIHPKAVLGSRVSLYHRVTIGEAKGEAPVIGSRIQIGAGATVLGGIKVSNDAEDVPTFVGANALVNKDVEHGTTVAGVPAKVVARR
ncbi:serine O-acetyltransferase [Arthrobacter mangrovi]|uniref:Serine acetyltransferase n=1 Tax=Arthrobacter mangrovi TaxID=2966350 RepID=A0ABQ5MV92_9MICC|nr:hypothetical protein [Arthrobacter mangrovi]GLB67917.1 hypothetical protein AHIS1636_23570 [Arthrobacter mangrovi]